MSTLGSAIMFAIAPALLALYIAGRYKFSSRSGEPPFTSYLIPWVGNIVAGSLYYETYMVHQAKKHSNRPFTFHVLGQLMTCFSDPDIAAVFYRNQDLSWEKMVFPLLLRAFGLPVQCLRYIEASFMHPLFAKYLTSTDGAASWTVRFAVALERYLPPAMEEGKPTELFRFGRSVIYQSATATLFGPNFPMKESENLFWKVDDNIFELFKEVPRILIPGVHDARKRLFGIIGDYLRDGGADESSEFVRAREKVHEENGVDYMDRAALHFITFWGLQANAPLAAIWATVHISHSPTLLADIRTELGTVVLPTATSSFNPQQTFDLLRLVELPLLNSLIWEVLRIYLTAGSIRLCTQDTSITHPHTGEVSCIRQGAFAQLVLQHVDHDPKVHDNEATFDAYRFYNKRTKKLDTKSRAFRLGLRPFGGGNGFCPGRVFARNEIAVFIASMVWWWDFEAAAEDQKIPGMLRVTKQGIQPPNGDYAVRAKARHVK